MRSLKTPEEISGLVRSFCSSVVPGAEPFYVEVKPYSDAVEKDCFINVENYIKANGGEKKYGWTIWIWPNTFIEAEFHSIIYIPPSSYLDVTPHNDDKRILFLPDESRKFENKRIDNIRKPLRRTNLILRFIQLWQEWHNMMESEVPSDVFGIVSVPREKAEPIMNELARIESILKGHVQINANAPCPCGSGRKYKKCCR